MKLIFDNDGMDWKKYARKVEGLAVRVFGPEARKNGLYANQAILYKEKVFHWRYANTSHFIYECIKK